jgi:hypothetical protein
VPHCVAGAAQLAASAARRSRLGLGLRSRACSARSCAPQLLSAEGWSGQRAVHALGCLARRVAGSPLGVAL